MSILGNIFNKIFHHPAAQPQDSAAQAPQQPMAQQAQSAPAAAAPSGQAQPAQVDVGAVLTQMASQKGGGGNWQSSIVDLLKLLDLDSSMEARKQLAGELNIHAGADGSAEENIALHRAVVQQLANNGGKIPDSMKH